MSGQTSARLSAPAQLEPRVNVIEGRIGSRPIDFRELWQYRDLFYFLVWRDIKARYAQTVLGFGWAIIQPVFTMVVFTVVFGNLAKVSSDGLPYALFSFAGLVPWTYFAAALSDASGSLANASNMLSKVYFPRIILPVAPMLGKLVDFSIAMVLLLGLMAWFGTPPTFWVVVLPLLVVIMMLNAAGLGMIVTALAVQYRDVKYALGFAVQLLMYAAPVVYPVSIVPERYRLLYGLNPMAGVIEGFRAALLGARPMPWDLIAIGGVAAVAIAIGGGIYFLRMERIFADVV